MLRAGISGDWHSCDYCDAPMATTITTRVSRVELCAHHAVQFTGWTAEEFAHRQARYTDHMRLSLLGALRKERENAHRAMFHDENDAGEG